MKKIILLVLALLVLIGAGVGGYVMFGPKPGHEGEQEEPKKRERKGPPAFASVGPMIVPILGAKTVEQNIMVTVSLEVDDDAAREQIRQQNPRLVDAYVQALYGGIDKGQVIDGQVLNIPALKAKLQEATDKVLGPGVVHDVLIQSVSQRPAY
ncbi:flagellar basal body-associated FliL family protein [Niveispirillum fermenti]|uniref:flagellar basal body-associated FliL family protein n=1 Tax=Niveispirillum fermenti TaxID=1233113 RepID=UPI003A89258C